MGLLVTFLTVKSIVLFPKSTTNSVQIEAWLLIELPKNGTYMLFIEKSEISIFSLEKLFSEYHNENYAISANYAIQLILKIFRIILLHLHIEN